MNLTKGKSYKKVTNKKSKVLYVAMVLMPALLFVICFYIKTTVMTKLFVFFKFSFTASTIHLKILTLLIIIYYQVFTMYLYIFEN